MEDSIVIKFTVGSFFVFMITITFFYRMLFYKIPKKVETLKVWDIKAEVDINERQFVFKKAK